MTNKSSLISKVWNFANVLRDDGVGYGDYLEQITYLLFLKMADEMSKPPYDKNIHFPRVKNAEGQEISDGDRCDWPTLCQKRGAELESFYSPLLRSLATERGMLGQIFTKSQNKIQDPAKLLKVIDMIGKEQWTMVGADIKGDIYEGLLEKNAEDTKSGAGQYFTPRSPTRKSSAGTRPISISSGSKIKASPTWTTCPSPTPSPKKSSKTSKPDSKAFARSWEPSRSKRL